MQVLPTYLLSFGTVQSCGHRKRVENINLSDYVSKVDTKSVIFYFNLYNNSANIKYSDINLYYKEWM